MQEDVKKICDYLRDIVNIGSPTGYTENVMDYVRNTLKSLGVNYHTTNKGAVVASIKGKDDENQITLSAHIDTLGAMVREIKADGKLSITAIGSFMMNSIEGENCKIQSSSGKTYSGTVQTVKPSVHISGDEASNMKRTPENMEVVIDEKVFSKEDVQKLGIDVGDFVCIDPRFKITESGFVKSRHLDDKASTAVLLYCMEYIKNNNITPSRTVNFFISNYEEVGHGAAAAIPEKTKEFISVDMGAPGLNQNSSEYAVCICAKDSSGPYDFSLRKKLTEMCIANNIDYKVDIYPHYGSDASCAVRAGWDVKTGLIGPGVFASHAYERTHIDSLNATKELVLKYII